MTAQNLIYLQDPKTAICAEKGSPEYDDIIERLEKTNYAHQQEIKEDGDELRNDKQLTRMLTRQKSSFVS